MNGKTVAIIVVGSAVLIIGVMAAVINGTGGGGVSVSQQMYVATTTDPGSVQPTPTPTAADPSPTPQYSSIGGDDFADNATQGPAPDSAWSGTAEGFAKAMIQTGGGKDAWIAALTPYSTSSLIAQLSATSPSTSPVTVTVEKIAKVSDNGGGMVIATATYTGVNSPIRMTLLRQSDGSYLVNSIG